MFENLEKFWEKYGFEIIIGASVLIIFFLSLFRIGKRGTFSDTYNYPRGLSSNKPKRVQKDSSGETECRRVLKQIFNKPFYKDRPDFLRNPVTGGNFNLEIDCFDIGMRLGCEYQGIQHYKYVPYFHKNKESFMNQKYRDDLKRRMCIDNGIKLIEVPYTVKVPDIKNYIIKELRKNGYNV
jgi:hypothetical protein